MTSVLLSSDGQTFTVDDPVARRSGVIASVLEDCGYDEAIPLLNVPADVLAKVLEYCDHHQNDPTPPPDGEWNSGSADLKARRSSPIDPWDAQYITCDQETLFEVIQAASYLDIKALLDLGCKTVANMMTGKSVEEIRELFHIENDFTPEEEDAMQVERSQLERWHDAVS
ncbi:putative negative regulator sulfur controller-3 [Clavulina sp. PMI_390]|nr:putative negative regulator sulfur controller-3 [Clavulina sp. PMI_390]